MHPYNVSPLMLIYFTLFAVFVAAMTFVVRVWCKPNSLQKKVLVTLAVLLFLAVATGVVYYVVSRALREFYETFRDFK